MSVDKSFVSEAVKTLLETEMAPVLVGLGVTPTPTGGKTKHAARDGYLVINALPGDYSKTGYAGGSGTVATVRYQLSGVGASAVQSERIASKAAMILADESGGVPVHALTVPGHTVMGRERSGSGPSEAVGSHQAIEFVDLMVTSG